MIVGHLGVAAATARWRPRASLPWLLAASIAPDLLDVGYALAGVCNPYGLYSHTVPAALLLGACLGGAAVLAGRRETGVLVLLVVLLHLPFDWPTGHKLVWPGGEMHGLSLYDRPLVDFLMECAVLLAGWALLRGSTAAPRWATGLRALLPLVALQGGADLLRHGLKPTACLAAPPLARPASGPAPARRAS